MECDNFKNINDFQMMKICQFNKNPPRMSEAGFLILVDPFDTGWHTENFFGVIPREYLPFL